MSNVEAPPVKRHASEYRELSLTARLAVGLVCFQAICDRFDVAADCVSEFLEYMWDFPLVATPEEFAAWESAAPCLVEAGLGEKMPGELVVMLAAQGVKTEMFAELLMNLVEIVWGSFYGASDDVGSLAHLEKILGIAGEHDIDGPAPSLFTQSRYSDRSGWGVPLTREARDGWRALRLAS